MGSLDKLKVENNKEVLEKFICTENNYLISEKLDGISLLVQHINNKWICYTRGNGNIGRNVSTTIIPYLNLPNIDHELIVRGEVILPIIQETDQNQDIDTKQKNLRNVVNGIINAKLPNINILSKIEFIAYSLPNSELIPSRQMKTLLSYGFKTVKHIIKPSLTIEFLNHTLTEWKYNKPIYEIDGLVITQDIVEPLIRGKNPIFSKAFKMDFYQQQKQSIVTNIIWNISKDKLLKPIVEIQPINIGNTCISKVTGNNAKFISSHKINIGCELIIIKSGDVIPKIIKIIKPSKEANTPKCDYKWNNNQTEYIAINMDNTLAILIHFVKTLNIKYINKGILTKLINANINSVEKLICLNLNVLKNIPNLGDKSSNKIINSIKTGLLNTEPILLMIASNCFGRNIGYQRLKLIVDKFTMDTFLSLTVSSKDICINLKGISDILFKNILKGIENFNIFLTNNPTFNDYFSKSFATQIIIEDDKPKNIFVFSGFRNSELEKDIKSKGHIYQNNINKMCNYLVVKNVLDCNKKTEYAKKNNIKIISLDYFISNLLL